MRINWVAVVISTIVMFVLRYLWIAHFGGADWGHFIGRAVNSVQNAPHSAGLVLANALVTSAVLGWLIGRLRDRVFASGLGSGVVAAVGFAATTVSAEYIYGQAELRTFLIDAGYYVAAYALAGAILGTMAPKAKAA
jgi:hypothetical protein